MAWIVRAFPSQLPFDRAHCPLFGFRACALQPCRPRGLKPYWGPVWACALAGCILDLLPCSFFPKATLFHSFLRLDLSVGCSFRFRLPFLQRLALMDNELYTVYRTETPPFATILACAPVSVDNCWRCFLSFTAFHLPLLGHQSVENVITTCRDSLRVYTLPLLPTEFHQSLSAPPCWMRRKVCEKVQEVSCNVPV